MLKVFVLCTVAVLAIGGAYFLWSGEPEPKIFQAQALPALTEGEAEEKMEKIQAEEAALSLENEQNKAADTQVSDEALSQQPITSAPNTVTPSPERNISSGKTNNIDRLVTFGFAVHSGKRTVDTVILHSSYDAVGGDPYSIEGILKEYKTYGVAAHYLIGRDGTIYRLVIENNIAYHAGAGKTPDGRTDINQFSIGIEMAGTLSSGYTEKQYAALENLLADIKKSHTIKYVLGHSDIAPGRKTDPWKFDWTKVKKEK